MRSRAFSNQVENHLLRSPSVVCERKQLTRAWMCQSKAGSSNLDFLRSRIKLLVLLSSWHCTYCHLIRLSGFLVFIEDSKDFQKPRFLFKIKISLAIDLIPSSLNKICLQYVSNKFEAKFAEALGVCKIYSNLSINRSLSIERWLTSRLSVGNKWSFVSFCKKYSLTDWRYRWHLHLLKASFGVGLKRKRRDRKKVPALLRIFHSVLAIIEREKEILQSLGDRSFQALVVESG